MKTAAVITIERRLSADGLGLITTRLYDDGSLTVVWVPVLGVKR